MTKKKKRRSPETGMEVLSKEEFETPKRSPGGEMTLGDRVSPEMPPRPGTEPQGFPAPDPGLPAR